MTPEQSLYNFNLANKLTKGYEGGYVNNPNDRGGATNFGITQATYNRYCSQKGLQQKDVRLITIKEVDDIYFNDYWIRSSCHLMLLPLCVVHYDTAVNFGVSGANKMLQRVLEVEPDGVIGKITLSKIDSFKPIELAQKYISMRMTRRYEIVEHNPTQKVFLKGWLNRDNNLSNYIIKL